MINPGQHVPAKLGESGSIFTSPPTPRGVEPDSKAAAIDNAEGPKGWAGGSYFPLPSEKLACCRLKKSKVYQFRTFLTEPVVRSAAALG